MNFLINRLDNLVIGSKSFEFIPANIKKEINMNGILGDLSHEIKPNDSWL